MLQMFCWTFWPNTSPVPPHQLAFDTPADTVRETFGRNSVVLWGTGIRFASSPPKTSFGAPHEIDFRWVFGIS